MFNQHLIFLISPKKLHNFHGYINNYKTIFLTEVTTAQPTKSLKLFNLLLEMPVYLLSLKKGIKANEGNTIVFLIRGKL